MNCVSLKKCKPLIGLLIAGALLAGCGGGSTGISAVPNHTITTQRSIPQPATITFNVIIHSETPGDRTISMTMKDASGTILIVH